MALKFYNTKSREKEEFVPVEKGRVKFYVCGPTVYDFIHIGNARAFIVFDVIRRFLQFLDYDVTYVMNLTDIDDKIIERASRDGVNTSEITETYGGAFLEDLKELGIKPADSYPKATDHVPEIIAMIQKLISTNYAYEIDGDVYFEVSKFDGYGKLSGKKTEDLISGSRVSVNQRKNDPLDFALWKAQKPGEPGWNSPWGKGRPGWHIECSAMSIKYLGESFDIHAGGTDLVFPHHENELAQSEAATKKPFVKYWLHNGFLQIDGEKMAKSMGNFRTVREFLEKMPGIVLRLFFLQKHYRSPIDLTSTGLVSAQRAVSRLAIFVEKLESAISMATEIDSATPDPAQLTGADKSIYESLDSYRAMIVSALEDDFNTPVALSHLFDMVRDVNKYLSQESSPGQTVVLPHALNLFYDINAVFGIYEPPKNQVATGLTDSLVQLLISLRENLRAKKEWELADKVRDELKELGIVLEDSQDGTKWRKT